MRHELKAGCEYALQAIELLSSFKDKRTFARVISSAYVFVLHRRSDLNYHGLVEGHDAAMATGSAEVGCWIGHFLLDHGLFSGKIQLDTLNADVVAYTTEMRELQQEMIYNFTRMSWQVLANLRGGDGNTGRAALTGDFIDEATMLDGVENGTLPAICHPVLNRYQYLSSFWFEDWDRVVEIYRDTSVSAMHKKFPGQFVCHLITAYVSLGMLSLYRLHGKKKHLRLAKSFKANVKQWVEEGNPNFVHFLHLIEAEFLDVMGGAKKREEARARYEKGTKIAHERGAVQDEALCCQRHGEWCLRDGQSSEGKLLLERAIRLYEVWGARALVRHVQDKHRNILTSE